MSSSNLQTCLLVKEIWICFSSILILFLTFGLIMLSYFHIPELSWRSLCRGQTQGLFTTGSHLTVVTIYYGPAILAYMSPHSHLPRMRVMSLQCCMIGWTHSLHSEKQGCERFLMRKVVKGRIMVSCPQMSCILDNESSVLCSFTIVHKELNKRWTSDPIKWESVVKDSFHDSFHLQENGY